MEKNNQDKDSKLNGFVREGITTARSQEREREFDFKNIYKRAQIRLFPSWVEMPYFG